MPSRILVGAVLVAAAVGLLALTGVLARAQQVIPGLRQATPTYQTVTVSRGNVQVSVIATGPVAAVSQLPLTFKTSGKLSELDVNVGDQVKKGQVLARLDTTDLQTALDQAKANLAQAQANLAKLEAGATVAQQQVAQAAVQSASTAVSDAQANLATTRASTAKDVAAAQAGLQIAQTNLAAAQAGLVSAQQQQTAGLAADQSAVTNAQKNLIAVQASVAANLPVLEQQLQKAKDDLWSTQISRDATCGRSQGADCQAANANVAAAETAVNAAQAQLDAGVKQGQQQVAQAQAQLDQARAQLANDQAKLDAAVVSAQNQVKQAQASLANAQTAVAQAQARAAATVQTAQTQIDQAESQLQAARASYNEVVAPPTPADVAAARAQVTIAQAAVQQAQANLDAATLVAPFAGTVAAVNGSVGQWITGGPINANASVSPSALVTLINPNDLQVVAQVNEADIGKVKVGDPVNFTVSAYPNLTFQGRVLDIQPIGTVVQNVVNYNVTCSIQSTADATLYPGMTAAATIISQQANHVLLVPNAALSFAQTAIRDGLVQLGEPGRTTGATGGNLQAGRQRSPGSSATGRALTGRPGGASGFGRATAIAAHGVVLTLKSGELVPIQVTLGLSDGTNTEVISGLREGETVVVGQTGGGAANRSSGARPAAGPIGGPFGGGFRG